MNAADKNQDRLLVAQVWREIAKIICLLALAFGGIGGGVGTRSMYRHPSSNCRASARLNSKHVVRGQQHNIESRSGDPQTIPKKKIPYKYRVPIGIFIFAWCFTLVFGLIDHNILETSLWAAVEHATEAAFGALAFLALFEWMVNE